MLVSLTQNFQWRLLVNPADFLMHLLNVIQFFGGFCVCVCVCVCVIFLLFDFFYEQVHITLKKLGTYEPNWSCLNKKDFLLVSN